MAELSGSSIGPYHVRDLIGKGGMAEVYRAVHRDGSEAALKALLRTRLGERDKVKAFEVEIAQMRRLNHPAIPKVLHDGVIDNRPCFIMDFINGDTLHALVTRKEPLPGAALVRTVVDIVAYLHGMDLVHNDLKLENMILSPEGQVSLVDFGSVREVRNRVITAFFLRKSGSLFGTATYLAPELIHGKPPTTESDVYALGVCAYMLLAGRPPFDAASQSGRLKAHLMQAPPSIRSFLPQLPSAVASVIDSCLAKDPDRRPRNATDLRDALKAWQRPPSASHSRSQG